MINTAIKVEPIILSLLRIFGRTRPPISCQCFAFDLLESFTL